MKRRLLACSAMVLALGLPRAAAAQSDEAPPKENVPPEINPLAQKSGYAQLFFTTYVGDGLRFNNPYRLATPLGSDAESVSRTASYVDIGIGATFGHPLGIQHGATLRTSVSLTGVGQAVMTPSYLAWKRWRELAVSARVGTPIILTQDISWGGELAVGATYFFLGGFGVSAELVGDIFYGAGTAQRNTTTYPVLSGQIGFVIAYEVLP